MKDFVEMFCIEKIERKYCSGVKKKIVVCIYVYVYIINFE